MELISQSLMRISILLDYASCFSAKSVARIEKNNIVKRKLDIARNFESQVHEDSIEHV